MYNTFILQRGVEEMNYKKKIIKMVRAIKNESYLIYLYTLITELLKEN